MTSNTSRFPVVAKHRRPAQLGSAPAAMILGSLLVAAAIAFQSPVHATPPDVGVPALAAIKGHDSAAKIAELEKGFWVCDYLGTTRGTEGPHAADCGANYEELKQTKFGGDFDALVDWWRINKAEQHAALESAISAQF